MGQRSRAGFVSVSGPLASINMDRGGDARGAGRRRRTSGASRAGEPPPRYLARVGLGLRWPPPYASLYGRFPCYLAGSPLFRTPPTQLSLVTVSPAVQAEFCGRRTLAMIASEAAEKEPQANDSI